MGDCKWVDFAYWWSQRREEGLIDEYIDGMMDEWIYGYIDGMMDGYIDGMIY